MSRTDQDVRELRLALVLPGGVSLAIYMFGVTRELLCLVKASAPLDQGAPTDTATPSERAYVDLLMHLAELDREGVRTRVVVDTIAGTSAGGINGVYLAKALAHNRSLGDLRDLWLRNAEMAKLLRGPTLLPKWLRVPWLALTVWRAPLRGKAISRWLLEALEAMDARGPEPVVDDDGLRGLREGAGAAWA